jgi:hypothetical protein
VEVENVGVTGTDMGHLLRLDLGDSQIYVHKITIQKQEEIGKMQKKLDT